MTQLHPIIINADDFGMRPEGNRAIIDSLHQGLCSSTTLMANLPGFDDACQLGHENKIIDCVGLHLNLGEGSPLTDAMRKSPKFCDGEGHLKLVSDKFTSLLNADEARLLASEIRAQIARCRKMGFPLTHVDSHRHLHVQWGILRVLLAVAGEESIPYVRIPRNCGRGIGLIKAIYKRAVTGKIARRNMRRTVYFGGVADYLWLKSAGLADGSMEIMVHPRYQDGGMLCDYPSNLPLAQQVQRIDGYRNALSFARGSM